MFNLILKTGNVPEQWTIGKIKQIYKNKGDSLDPSNYRLITILSCLVKLFTAVLNDKLCNFLEDNNLLNENQAGFRKHHSITDHIFTLYSLIALLKHEKKKQKLFCCFVGFSKAFDPVWREGLWRKLLFTHVNGIFLCVLQNMYANIKSCVTVNGQDSQFFNSNRGVKQGDNLLPLLFSLFFNDLEDHLLADQVNGIPVEYKTDDFVHSIQIFILLYADDTISPSDSAENLQKCLDSFLKYCSDWKLQVNETKTKVVIFGARKTNSYLFKLGKSPLEIVDNYKYLGTVSSKIRSFFKARNHIAEQARKAMHLLQMRIKNLHLPAHLQLKLFDQTILLIMTYSCETFGIENCGLFEKKSYSVSSLCHPSKKRHSTLYGLR